MVTKPTKTTTTINYKSNMIYLIYINKNMATSSNHGDLILSISTYSFSPHVRANPAH